jgi:hypothetical protein
MNNEIKIFHNTFSDEYLEEIIERINTITTFNRRFDNIYHFYGSDLSINRFQNVIVAYKKLGIILEDSQINTFRVQKIDDSINVTETYHVHDESIPHSIVTFLNDDFEGGLFEYSINGEVKTIKPVKNMTLFFDGSILHRVTKVKGLRTTLVLFLNDYIEHKKIKTII